MNDSIKKVLLAFILTSMFSLACQAQNQVSGIVNDSDGIPVIGASLVIKGSTEGVAADFDGKFTLSSETSFPWTLVISSTGYFNKEIDITSNQSSSLTITLKASVSELDEVVISASRKAEKITESPASVSVLSAATIATQPIEGDALNLIKNIQGVRLVNNGVAKLNVSLRGQALVNETQTLVLKDYRSLHNAHTTIIDNERMGVNPLDIDRIEVVRGPSGALWGPGVNAGVVHFLTKDPFRHPGTSISYSQSIEGQNIKKFNFRHAASSDKFGYKILFAHRSGDDFVYDLQNQDDIASATALLNAAGPPSLRDGIIQGVVGGPDVLLPQQVDANGNLTYNLIPEFHSNTVEASFEYKPNKDITIALAPQYGESEINFRNAGSHTRDWGNILNVQSRINYKKFFVSLNYFNAFEWDGNNGSTSRGNRSTALITTGTDNRGDIKVYDFASQLPISGGEKWDFVTGLDAKFLRFDGSGVDELVSRHGRYEDDDNFDVIGGYFQATYSPSEKIKINAVARLDNFSIYGSAFSPRIGFVYNPDDDKNKALRISMSRAYRSPSPILSNFDFALAGNNLLGARNPITFNNTLIDYDGVGLDPNTVNPTLQDVLETIIPNLDTVDQATLLAITVAGNATSALTDPLNGTSFNTVSDQFISSAELESTDAIEIGYTGLSTNKKFKYTVDAFYQVQQNMIENFTAVGPIVSFNNVGSELEQALTDAGVSPDVIQRVVTESENIYTGTSFNALSDQHQEVGIDESTPFPSSGFRSFEGKAKYFGVEANFQYTSESGFIPFATFSWLSDTVFDTEELNDTPGSGRTYFLNTSPFRARFGMKKISLKENGFYGSFAGRYDAPFDARDGVWNGEVDSYFLVDAAVGYKFKSGVNIGINATNLTDVLFRALPNIPAQRRLIFLTFSYDLGENILTKK